MINCYLTLQLKFFKKISNTRMIENLCFKILNRLLTYLCFKFYIYIYILKIYVLTFQSAKRASYFLASDY